MVKIAQGAEAILTKNKDTVSKQRVKKSYRYPDLDNKIRKQRTRREARILVKARKVIPVPKVINSSEQDHKIDMEFIYGKKLSIHLEKLPFKEIAKLVGQNIAKLHDSGIIHGDLTTSNMIYTEPGAGGRGAGGGASKDLLYFIDFGLSFHSDRNEDKAVDLHLIHEALEAKHPTIYKETYKEVINSYKKTSKKAKEVLTRLEKVEKRGRYKQQY